MKTHRSSRAAFATIAVEDLDNPLTKSNHMMDKLVDELAKGQHGQSPAPRLSDRCPRPSTDAEPVGVLEEGQRGSEGRQLGFVPRGAQHSR